MIPPARGVDGSVQSTVFLYSGSRFIGSGVADRFEAVLAALAAAFFYVRLYGELPYHDVARFANQVNSGHFVWDIGHIFLQPATLLWHSHLGFGEAAEASQRHINTFATAAGIGIFYALLQWLGIVRRQRVFAAVLVIASSSLVILAPSGHMKLLAFPFVNAALFILICWERATRTDAGYGLITGAVLLAVAACFLASALATAPFVMLAVLVTRLRERAGWLKAVLSAGLFAVVCGGTFVLLACVGYSVFAGAVPSLHGLTASVTDKADLKPAAYRLAANLARLVFGTVNNLITSPDLGSILRASMTGQISSLAPYGQVLVVQAIPWTATLALLAAIYLGAIRGLLLGTRCLVPAAFLCGAQTWTIYYGLNDPEHWFQLTVPTVVLFLLLFPARLTAIVLPPWATLTALINVVVFAMPYAAYPLKSYEAGLRRTFSANDLLVSFVAYAGGPSLTFFQLQDVPELMLDAKLHESPTPAAFYAEVDRDLVNVFAHRGRVVVLGSVLDPYDWNAPWGDLPSRGVSKQQLSEFFYSHYQVKSLGRLAEIKAWEILPSDGNSIP